jgi:DNA gyrase inhibitor GyrI
MSTFLERIGMKFTRTLIADDYIIADAIINETQPAGGKYAVFPVAHTIEAVQKAWSEIFFQLPIQSHHFDLSRPILERYSSEMINK